MVKHDGHEFNVKGDHVHHGSRPRLFPTKSLMLAAQVFMHLGGRNVVEIGTGMHGFAGGNSANVWASRTNASHIWCLDLDPKMVDAVANWSTAHDHNSRLHPIMQNGLHFLGNYSTSHLPTFGPIDLLMLDFWKGDGHDREQAYIEAYSMAKPILSTRALILIDDVDHAPPWNHSKILWNISKTALILIDDVDHTPL